MTRKVFRHSSMLAMSFATISFLPSTGLAQDTEASAGSTGPQLEEIVVTAQRKSQKLQDVPIAVSAISASGLESRGINSTISLGQAIPGLQVDRASTVISPYLRGVGSNASNPNNEASVATYVDGVYIAAPYANALSFNNIDRIEVLKGPQGTLFGRNATGGVIQVITRTPKHEPSLDFSLGYGNYNTVDVGAYVTGGLSNTIAADIAVQYRNQQDGYGHDTFRNVDVFRGRETNLRSKVLWEPTATTSITLAVDYAKLDNDYQNFVFPPGASSPVVPTLGYNGRYVTSTDVGAVNDTKAYGASLTVRHDVGFAELVSISARRIAKGTNQFDRDSTPVPILSFQTPQSVKTWSQELQLNSNSAGPLSWTLGGFYFHNSAGYVPARLVGFAFSPNPLAPNPNSEFDVRGVQKTDSYSAYGQATYEILANLNLTGGLRYTHEKTDVTWAVGSSPDATVTPVVLGPEIGDSTGFDRLTWRVALDYEFVPDVHGYVSYNRGIKSGGFDLLSPGFEAFKPEVLDSYETGIKSELFERRLRLNVSAFLYKYKDIQVLANPFGSTITINGARATIKGLDADFEAAITRGLRLSGGLGYLDSEFDDFPNPNVFNADGTRNLTLTNAKGNRLTHAPKITGNLGLSYSVETAIGRLVAAGSFYHNSGYFWDVDNRLRAPAYDIVGASLSWTDPEDRLGLRLWAENLNDEHCQIQGSVGEGVGDNVIYAAPRTYGVTLTGNF